MKFTIEIEILNNNIESNEDSETHLTKQDLKECLEIGFLDDDGQISFGAYHLEKDGEIPFVKGITIVNIN